MLGGRKAGGWRAWDGWKMGGSRGEGEGKARGRRGEGEGKARGWMGEREVLGGGLAKGWRGVGGREEDGWREGGSGWANGREGTGWRWAGGRRGNPRGMNVKKGGNMRVNSEEGQALSGKMGNLVYYTRNGRTYVRRARIPGKKRKWEVEGREAPNEGVARRFATVQRVYSLYAREVSAEVWRAAGRAAGMMAANLFCSRNFRCFSSEGELANPEGFRFAEGELTLPPGLRVTAGGSVAPGESGTEGGVESEGSQAGVTGGSGTASGMEGAGSAEVAGLVEGSGAWDGVGMREGGAGSEGEGAWFEVEWEGEEAWSLAAPGDRLVAGVLYEDDMLTVRLAAEACGTRGDGRGWFRLEEGHGEVAHVYLFFAREDGRAFSPSRYFRVTTGSAGA